MKVDSTKRGIFIGLLAYTALSSSKMAGNQKFYVNDRNEVATGLGDFMRIGSECLKYDLTDIDANGWDSYTALMTNIECFDVCRDKEDCVGSSFEMNKTTNLGHCGIISSSMSDNQTLIGLTEKQRLGRLIEDDGLDYSCFVKLG